MGVRPFSSTGLSPVQADGGGREAHLLPRNEGFAGLPEPQWVTAGQGPQMGNRYARRHLSPFRAKDLCPPALPLNSEWTLGEPFVSAGLTAFCQPYSPKLACAAAPARQWRLLEVPSPPYPSLPPDLSRPPLLVSPAGHQGACLPSDAGSADVATAAPSCPGPAPSVPCCCPAAGSLCAVSLNAIPTAEMWG